MVVRFGEGAIDLDRMEIRLGGELRPVQPQVFEVIRYLVERRDRVVTKEELLDEVWGDRFVSESTLTSRIKSARRALGDDGEAQAVIRTVHGRGYRFVADVTAASEDAPVQPAQAAPGPMPSIPPLTADSWPLVGRYELLERVLDAYSRPELAGVMAHGGRGSGTTRLVTEAARVWAQRGEQVALLATTAAMSAIPLAALAPLVPFDAVDAVDLVAEDASIAHAGLFRRASAAIAGRSSPDRRLIVVVDPGDHLDPLSQAVLASLMADRAAFVVATSRAGLGSHPFTELETAGRMLGVEVPALTVADLDALLYRVLAGPIDRDARDRIGQASGGRPGSVRDLVDSSLEAGTLTRIDGVWRLTGALASGRAREWPLPSLSDDARRAAEALALAGSLALGDAERLLGPAALDELDDAGLLDLTVDREPVVTLADPLQSETIVASVRPVRARAIKSELVGGLARESRRPADLATAVRWAAELGTDVDAAGALAAASLALQQGDDAAAEVLTDHAVRSDPGLDAYAAVVRAELCYGRAQFERAERLLEAVDRTTLDPRTAAFVVRRMSVIRYQFREDYHGSVDWLAEQEAAASGGAADWIAGQRAVNLALIGRIDEALALIERLRPAARGTRALELALAAAGANLQHGDFARCEESLTEAGRLIAELQPAPAMREMIEATATSVRLQLLLAVGRLDAAAELVRPMLGRRVSTYWSSLQGAMVELEGGRPRAARELVLPTVAIYRAHGQHNGLAAATALQARVCAELGQTTEAERLLDEVVAFLPRLTGAGDWPVTKSLCRLAWLLGQGGDFTSLALDQADSAARSAAFRNEAELLATAAATDPSPAVARSVTARVTELAARLGGLLYPVLAEHVRRVAHDESRDPVVRSYTELGYLGWARVARGAGPASER